MLVFYLRLRSRADVFFFLFFQERKVGRLPRRSLPLLLLLLLLPLLLYMQQQDHWPSSAAEAITGKEDRERGMTRESR